MKRDQVKRTVITQADLDATVEHAKRSRVPTFVPPLVDFYYEHDNPRWPSHSTEGSSHDCAELDKGRQP